MRGRPRRPGLPAALLLGFVGLGGCHGRGDAAGPADAQSRAPAEAPLRCDDWSLARRSATPLDTVTLVGVTGGRFEALRARVRVAGEGAEGVALVGRKPDGTLVLQVPGRPDGGLGAATLEIRPTDGDLVCPPRSLELAALRPAPGATAATLDALAGFVDAQVRLFGTTPQRLRNADPDTLAPPLVPLLAALAAVGAPSRPGSLLARARALEGARDTAGPGAFVDALLARGGTAEELRALTAEVQRHTSDLARGAERHGPVLLASFAPGPGHPVAEAFGPAESYFNPTPAELSHRMELALWARLGTSGRPAHLLDVLGSTMAMAAGTAKFFKAESVAEEAGAIGSAVWAYKQAALAASHLLPGRMSDLEVDLSQTSFDEDDPGPGEWHRVRITARSEPWKMSTFALESMSQLAGMESMGGISWSWEGRFASKAFTAFLDQLRDFVINDLLGQLAQEATRGPDAFDFPPETFHTVVPDGETGRWLDVNYIGRAVQFAGPHSYSPRRTGTTVLRIATKGGKFGDQQRVLRRDLVVHGIEVTFDPESTPVRAGQVVALHVTVDHALDPSLGWKVLGGGRLVGIPQTAPDQVVKIQVPRDPQGTITVKATSTADRSHLAEAPERSGYARLEPELVAIEPANPCVDPGDQQAFSALYLGRRVQATWTADLGPIDRDGLYRAPSSPGQDRVKAAVRGHPELETSVTVQVGRCAGWTATVSGEISGTYSGTSALAGLQGVPAGPLAASPLGVMDSAGGRVSFIGLSSPREASPNLRIMLMPDADQQDAHGISSVSETEGGLWLSDHAVFGAVPMGTVRQYILGTPPRNDRVPISIMRVSPQRVDGVVDAPIFAPAYGDASGGQEAHAAGHIHIEFRACRRGKPVDGTCP